MQNTSSLYKEILSGEHWKECQLVIGEPGVLITEQNERILFGGVSILVDKSTAEDVIVSMNTYSSLFSEDMPVAGECVASEFSATILKPKADIPRMSRVIPYVRLCNGEKKSEWIQKGVYYIDRHSYSGEETELMQIHGFDAMLFSEADFPSSDEEWPRTDIDVVRDIALDMGVTVDPRTVDIMNKGYMVQYPAEYSQREILGYLASMYAGSFVMTETGELRLIQLNGISDSIDLDKSITKFTKVERFAPYSKIIISITDELFYEAGDYTGRTLTISCPWGTQEMAENILAYLGGYSYQPFTAEGAILDPAAELGDGISVNGVNAVMYRIDTTFNSNCSAIVSAPFDEQINYEFPYESKLNREIKRNNKRFSSQLAIHADQIEAEVNQRIDDVKQINAQLTIQSDQITAEVAERKDEIKSVKSTLDIQAAQIVAKVNKNYGSSETFGWALETDSWRIFAGTSTVLKATRDGLEVKGKVTATSGEIGGFTINNNHISYNGQTWGGTAETGIYIGISGIQLGANFKVDNAGNLTAYSGTFEGSVNAGSIRHGDSYGTLSGSALTSNSVSGSRLAYNTVTTSYTSAGINTSLGWADFANGVFNGWNTVNHFKVIGGGFIYGEYAAGWEQIKYKDHDGNDKTVRVLSGR